MTKITIETITTAINSAVSPLNNKIDELCNVISALKEEIHQLRYAASAGSVIREPGEVEIEKHNYAAAELKTLRQSNSADEQLPLPSFKKPERPAAVKAKEKLTKMRRPPITGTKAKPAPKFPPALAKPSSTSPGADPNADPSANYITETLSDDTAGEWKEVFRRKTKLHKLVNGTATNTSLEGVEQMKYLHGCYFKNTTTNDDIVQYLKLQNSHANFNAKLITSKHDNYNSYKIGIPSTLYESYLSPAQWPVNIRISPWRPFLSNKERRQPTA
ncbi:hypothetical protein O0L34_g8064 [Tuta absoluta]|nr:hypothetical protein O0L34_g8064 [Tuta absoluta]